MVRSQQTINVFADVAGNDSLQKTIAILEQQLNRSQPVRFHLSNAGSPNNEGIYLSLAPAASLNPPRTLAAAGVEGYWLETKQRTVKIVGNSNMAISHGVFAWLYALGYRYYFANADWHIIPEKINLYAPVSVVSSPDFGHRRIWYGYGTGSKQADADYNFWVIANRMGGSMNAYFGHAYAAIVARNKNAFLQHPEWFYPTAKKGTIPNDPKFDVSNEELVQLVIRDTEKEIETSLKTHTSKYKMISLGPSDGLGTCNTPACQKLGTLTDRVYYLVNRVAKAIRQKYPSSWIGCLAYSEYIAPPTKQVEPNVFVGLTTAFNTSNMTIEQLLQQWAAKGATVGLYDYFSWYLWDFDVPGQSLASKTDQLIRSIRNYYNKGARAYEAESSIGWVSKGLGYYLASKLMWDTKFDAEAAKEEFFVSSFRKAATTMKKLWAEWEANVFPSVREADLARWIDYANTASREDGDKAVQKRLFQVKSYLHYLSLYRNYQLSKSEADLQTLLSYGYRKLDDGSVSGYPAFFALGNRSGFKEQAFGQQAKWRSNNQPVTENEINQLLKIDRTGLKTGLAIKQFSAATTGFTTLTNISKYGKLIADSASKSNSYWFTNEWVIQVVKKGTQNYIDFIGDFVANPANKKPIKISVYNYAGGGVENMANPLVYYEYTAVQKQQKISLQALQPGYYSVIVEDPTKTFRIDFSNSINSSQLMQAARQVQSKLLTYAFIYVPEGVNRFNFMKNRIVEFITPSGRSLKYLNDRQEDIQVEVNKGEAGLWRVKLAGNLYVEGIPPYLGTSPVRMLIPDENKTFNK